MDPLVVDMLGTRGLPNRYGGSETCIEEVGSRLTGEGNVVRVFCRRRVTESSATDYRGMPLVYLPSVPIQVVDTLSHSLVALLWLAIRARRSGRGTEVAHFHGSGNGAVLPLARALRIPTVVTVDGPDWTRAKWGPVARRLMKIAARMSASLADVVVADSREAKRIYEEEFGVSPRFIPYGAPAANPSPPDPAALQQFGLDPNGYLLFVGRPVPEKEVHTLARAHAALPQPRPALAIVGGTPEESPYSREVASVAGDDCHFLGKVFGEDLSVLLDGAVGYVQPSAVEGTSPMLLTAMAHGVPVVASDIPQNHETVGSAGRYFRRGDVASLTEALAELIADPDRDGRGRELRERVLREYSWDTVTREYAEAYRAAVARRRPGGRG
jgi:glycosyltransferase involved in cell wall biosynthesis